MPEQRKTHEDLLRLLDDAPMSGTWRHRTMGNIVSVAGFGFIESTLEIVVIYSHEAITWVRPVAEFLEKFKRV